MGRAYLLLLQKHSRALLERGLCMARDVRSRESYHRDIAHLSRLTRAIEIDRRMSPKEKKELITHVNRIMVKLLTIGANHVSE